MGRSGGGGTSIAADYPERPVRVIVPSPPGGAPDLGTPEAFAVFIKREVAKWAEVIKGAGIKAD